MESNLKVVTKKVENCRVGCEWAGVCAFVCAFV